MPELRVDPAALRDAVISAGIPCGNLTPVGTPAKRQVLSDGKVLVRAAHTTAVLRNSPVEEVAWARQVGDVVAAQLPLTDPLILGAWSVTVWEWLDGFTPVSSDAWQHGRVLRRLHDLATPIAGPVVQVDQLASAQERLPLIRSCHTRNALSKMLDVANDVLAAADRGALVVSHGDAHDRNAIVVDGVMHLLDFDSAGMAHRHVDVASGLYAWRLNRLDGTAADQFLAGYGEHPDVDGVALDDLVWVRRVRATCTRAAGGQGVDDRLAELERTKPQT